MSSERNQVADGFVAESRGRRRSPGALRRTALAVALVGASLLLAGCTSSKTVLTSCPPGEKLVIVITNPKLKPPKLGATSTTVVGNRDNDAGEGRIPDKVPDPDIDANQRHPECVTTGLTPSSN